jgi:hypothetical protein
MIGFFFICGKLLKAKLANECLHLETVSEKKKQSSQKKTCQHGKEQKKKKKKL